MKIAMIFPPMLLGGRPLDLANWKTAARGTTGSEVQILAMTRELGRLGHAVHLFIPQRSHNVFEDVAEVFEFDELFTRSDVYDVICASLEVNAFRKLSNRPLRVCFQQCNDFTYGEPGFDDFLDVFVSPSDPHRDMLIGRGSVQGWPTTASKWEVLPNGCVPEEYPVKMIVAGYEDTVQKVPGRVVYISSPDRGLHWVLQAWPEIKRAVPHAELRIFYYSLFDYIERWAGREAQMTEPKWKDYALRASYIKKALPALAGLGVKAIGSVSRAQLAVELTEAEVLAFPVDCIDYTESFSCATLEACAAGAIPVLCGADSMQHLYGEHCPIVPPPMKEHYEEWVDLVIRTLRDPPKTLRANLRSFAESLTWPKVAEKLEQILTRRLDEKNAVRK